MLLHCKRNLFSDFCIKNVGTKRRDFIYIAFRSNNFWFVTNWLLVEVQKIFIGFILFHLFLFAFVIIQCN